MEEKKEEIKTPYSVLYEEDGDILQLGPFNTEAEAFEAARKAHDDGEWECDLYDQTVYLLRPDHRMIAIDAHELGIDDEDDDDDDFDDDDFDDDFESDEDDEEE